MHPFLTQRIITHQRPYIQQAFVGFSVFASPSNPIGAPVAVVADADGFVTLLDGRVNK